MMSSLLGTVTGNPPSKPVSNTVLPIPTIPNQNILKPEVPDLSHLSEEERKIIENVLKKQLVEEDSEKSAIEREKEQLMKYDAEVRHLQEESRLMGIEDGSLCQICHKTKFGDGLGHRCHYCQLKSCVNCGSKTTLHSNKLVWICELCKRKQSLLAKTGQWYHGNAPSQPPVVEQPKMGTTTPNTNLVSTVTSTVTLKTVTTSVSVNTNASTIASIRTSSNVTTTSNVTTPNKGSRSRTSSQQPHMERQDNYQRIASPSNRQSRPKLPRPMPGSGDSSEVYHDSGYRSESTRTTSHDSVDQQQPPRLAGLNTSSQGGQVDIKASHHHLEPSSHYHGQRPRPKRYQIQKADSLSSDQSDHLHHVNEPGSRSHHPYRKHSGHGSNHWSYRGQTSFSSSEEELRSTPDFTSCDDVDTESLASEFGLESWDDYNGPEDSNWLPRKPWQPPIHWTPDLESNRLLGRMVLQRLNARGDLSELGLKVQGGRRGNSGKLGAFIVKVKRGAIADIVGHLRPGDEVLEWNGKSLRNATKSEVTEIVMESKDDPEIELVVSRNLSNELVPGALYTSHRHHTASAPPDIRTDPLSSALSAPPATRRLYNIERPSLMKCYHDNFSSSDAIVGQIQLKLWYDTLGGQLIVTVVCAVDLVPRDDGDLRNPYVKMYLLPERHESSIRRTMTIRKSNKPYWNQSFAYPFDMDPTQSQNDIEFSVWDYYLSSGIKEFLGEVVICLHRAPIDDAPRWYDLQMHDPIGPPLPLPSPPSQIRHRRHMPPSNHSSSVDSGTSGESLRASRSPRYMHSDSDLSDFSDDAIGLVKGDYHDSLPTAQFGSPLDRDLFPRNFERFLPFGNFRRPFTSSRPMPSYTNSYSVRPQAPMTVPNTPQHSRRRVLAPRRNSIELLEATDACKSPIGRRIPQTAPPHYEKPRIPLVHKRLPRVGHNFDERFLNREERHREGAPRKSYHSNNTRGPSTHRIYHRSGHGSDRERQSDAESWYNSDMETRSERGASYHYTKHGGEYYSSDHEFTTANSPYPPRRRIRSPARSPNSSGPSTPTQGFSSSTLTPNNLTPTNQRSYRPKPRMYYQDDTYHVRIESPVKTEPQTPQTAPAVMTTIVSTSIAPPTTTASSTSAIETQIKKKLSPDNMSMKSEDSNVSSELSALTKTSDVYEVNQKIKEFNEIENTPQTRNAMNRSQSQAEVDGVETINETGAMSDSGMQPTESVRSKKRRPSIGHKLTSFVGLSKKSNSLGQLQAERDEAERVSSKVDEHVASVDSVSLTGSVHSLSAKSLSSHSSKSRFGISGSDGRAKKVSIQRTEEVGFHTDEGMRNFLNRYDSHESTNDGSIGSASSDGSPWLQTQLRNENHLTSFVDDLGPGQLVGRQVLGSPCLGSIQLELGLKNGGGLRVRVVCAKYLLIKPGAKFSPNCYVKVYLMEGKRCVAKQKTSKYLERTLNPHYNHEMFFDEDPRHKTLQVTVWGDYGRMDRKSFMGVAQIALDDLNLFSKNVEGWYKLFTTSSLVEHRVSTTDSGSVVSLSTKIN